MTRTERIAAVLLLLGLLFCTSAELLGCIIGVALLGIGAVILNTPRRRLPESRRTRKTAGRVSHDLSM